MRGQEDAMASLALHRLNEPGQTKGASMLSWRRWAVVVVFVLIALFATSVQA